MDIRGNGKHFFCSFGGFTYLDMNISYDGWGTHKKVKNKKSPLSLMPSGDYFDAWRMTWALTQSNFSGTMTKC